ncbi:1-(5-phosphoribosyl)-5[(5-phosphoribosylamino)methylideneamino]imidazole-4-carboxamidisomerase [Malassezia nana]|uniref:1-(5-phosphoribosyl)-5-[(5-phosphoribosylamino)methylideneamino] imidazole-4-carboxamide isomerase n=1 Tax=Malassezia nana TaxID=180528 RepID=A0AAF0J2K6_9BASI|nr:1-(5-phosphoribosyl)-5[(5-phosphoribosylamino)methylideneamino]imidazole-4-carboxamidisomerase [Malassezia nana]
MASERRRSQFRPCIDLHHGTVKQIVGGSLRSAKDGSGDDTEALKTNFVATHPPAYYAALYAQHDLRGGHVIKLGPGNDEAAAEALQAWPQGLQVGGGIALENAAQWLKRGADKVIVTSYLFPECRFSMERLVALERLVGREHLVVDISCRRRGDDWVVAINRWQDLTDMVLSQGTQASVLTQRHWTRSRRTAGTPLDLYSELLIHAADVEGLCRGVDQDLVQRGARHMDDMRLVDTLSHGRVDLTFGSALDIFGGTGVTLAELVQWNQAAPRS